jgi:2',3'-cyclic-nucleotide 2'-phosphodiesterase (5'-nucleotidase family)
VAANKARAAAQREGAKLFILLTHMGITGFDPVTGAAFGPLIDLANNVGGYNLILGDHTDFQYTGIHNNALVVENRSKGATYARIILTVDAKNGRVVSSSNEFVVPLVSAVTPDPAIESLLQPYRDALGPVFNEVVGNSNVFIPRADSCGRSDGRLCESLVGNVTTDAMRLAYGTDFAITNSGGLRADLTCPTVDTATDFCPAYTPPPNPISRGQVLTVLPFGNVVVTVTINGAELKDFLENGVSSMPGANGRFPQVSGLCFTYDIAAPAFSRVLGAVRQAPDGSCTGAPVDLTAASTYTLATNDFVANGGDGYPVVYGRSTTREIMDQTLANYVTASGTVSPAIQGRIVCTTSGATPCPVILP